MNDNTLLICITKQVSQKGIDMNLTLPSYFRLVKFQRLSKKEQVLHLLFFVTVVAELRKDMTPRIISHRISDRKNRISSQEVKSIFEDNQYYFQISNTVDLRDRQQDEQAYELTDQAKKELIREANIKFAKIRFWTRPIFLIPVLFSLAFFAITIGLFVFHIVTYSDIADISWTKYKDRVSLNKATSENRAKYLLYFITEHIRFKADMTPEVLSNRLKDLGYDYIPAIEIEKHFKDNPKIFSYSIRNRAYKLTKMGTDEVRNKLALVPSKDSGLFALKWFLEYELTRASLLIPAFFVSCFAVWSAGIFIGNLSNWFEKILPEPEE